jgi:hypothetical protein
MKFPGFSYFHSRNLKKAAVRLSWDLLSNSKHVIHNEDGRFGKRFVSILAYPISQLPNLGTPTSPALSVPEHS